MSQFDFPEIDKIMTNSIKYIKNKEKLELYRDKIGAHIFRFSNVDLSWIDFATLGARDYFQSNDINFCQVICENSFCIDDPVMSLDIRDPSNHSWKYLVNPWPYEVKENSDVLVDLDVLSGKPIKTISRYELDYWEMFSSVDFSYQGNDAKIIPLSVIIERYPHLEFSLSMEIDTTIKLEFPE